MEVITFPPSTELIQDEYKHEDNEMGLVYIFYSIDDTKSMLLLKRAFNDQGYKVLPENTIKITKREVVLNALQRIASDDNSDKTCLMIFILGNTIIEDDLLLPENETNEDRKNCITFKDVWINFTREHCDSFVNKPKLFLFQGSPKPAVLLRDFSFKEVVNTEHDFPAEADMLMIYNKVDASRRTRFVESFCNGLYEFGKEDDVLGIVTRFEQHRDQRPLIISTLTRKFFMSPHKYRGSHYEYNSNYDSFLNMVCALNKKVDLVTEWISNSKRSSGPKRNSSMHVVDGRPRKGTPIDRTRTTSASSTRPSARTTTTPQKKAWKF